MDQDPLVTGQVDAGRRFLDEFEKYAPVRAAFWLKADEDSGWYLYVASDRINDRTIDPAYGEVPRLAGAMQDPNFDPFQVKLIGADDPLAREASETNRRYPARLPTRLSVGRFGGTSVEGVYLYPPTASAPSA